MNGNDSSQPRADRRIGGDPRKGNPGQESLRRLDRVTGGGDQLEQTAQWVRRMPDLEPPEDFVPCVMQAVRAKEIPWWRRLRRWAMYPRSITITPMRLMPAAICALAACIIWGLYLFGKTGDDPNLKAQAGIPVIFTVTVPRAQSVAVIGTFNQWRGRGYEMTMDRDGQKWTLTIRLPSGRYEYAFLVDGRNVVPDPGALFYQEDGFGHRNSVLILGNGDEKTI